MIPIRGSDDDDIAADPANRRTFAQLVTSSTRGLLERQLREYIQDIPFQTIPTYKGMPPPASRTAAAERRASTSASQNVRGSGRDSSSRITAPTDTSSNRGSASPAAAPSAPGGVAPNVSASGADFRTSFAATDGADPTRSADFRYCLQRLAEEFHSPYEVQRNHVEYRTFVDVLKAPTVPLIERLDPKVVPRPAVEKTEDDTPTKPDPVAIAAATAAQQEERKIEVVQLNMSQAQYLNELAALRQSKTINSQAQASRHGPLNYSDIRPRGGFTVHEWA